jgi:Ala-tRNA(Pro) deacylase
MPARSLQTFLDSHQVKYVTIPHSPAFTAQEIAASAHIPGKQLAKTVIVKLDGKLAMAVLPASDRVDVERLKAAAGARTVALANEQDFQDRFPECETGAMPPFGNLYGLDVWVAARLAEDEEIAFNAGDHTELMRMAYRDFDRLVQPTVGSFSST